MSEQLIVKVDSQLIEVSNVCPEKYNLQYVQNWKPRRKAAPLEKGSLVHQMFEHYYRERMNGRNEMKHQRELIEECEMMGRVYMAQSVNIEARDYERIFLPVFREYVLKYQHDGWDILGVEQPFSKVLYDSPKLHVDYEGKIDLLVNVPQLGKAVVDIKTESQFRNPFQLSNQFQGYEWAFDCPVIINKVGLQLPKADEDMSGEDTEAKPKKARFRRLIHQTGPVAIAEWREDTIRQVIEMIGWHKDIEAGKRLRKNRSSCDRWSGCEYQPICLEAGNPEQREYKLTTNFFKDKRWEVGLDEEEESEKVS